MECHVLTMLNVMTQKVVLSVAVSQDTQEMDMQAVQVCCVQCSSSFVYKMNFSNIVMSLYVHVCVFVGVMHPYAVCHGYYVP